jgi:hypothetical protein
MTMLDEEKVLEIAQAELEKHRRPVSDYEASIEPYAADPEKWIVWFEKKGKFRMPGGRNAVLVHKESGEAVFLPGE